jgi:hypothetical protein
MTKIVGALDFIPVLYLNILDSLLLLYAWCSYQRRSSSLFVIIPHYIVYFPSFFVFIYVSPIHSQG